MKYFLALAILILSLMSCSSLRKATPNENRVMLDQSNFSLIDGKYRVRDIQRKSSFDLDGSIFAGGYKFLKYDDICKDSLCYVQFKVINKKELELSYLTKNNQIRVTRIKGKLKNGYFVLKQSHIFLTLVFMNFYRNRQFRIGLLKNGNLITDHNQITMCMYLIFPIYDNDKNFDIEYQRID